MYSQLEIAHSEQPMSATDSNEKHSSSPSNHNQVKKERRKVPRPPRKEAQGALFYQLKFDKVAKFIFDTNIGRSVFVFSYYFKRIYALLVFKPSTCVGRTKCRISSA